MGAHGLRDVIAAIMPPWLQRGEGVADPDKRVAATLLYAMALVADALLDKVDYAMHAWLPTRTKTETSLVYIGQDRVIPRGPNEAASSYGVRLQRAFDSWRFAGMARGKLSQLLGFLSPATPRALQVSQFSDWYYYPDGADTTLPPTHLFVSPINWDWDSVSDPAFYQQPRWWRIWVILDATGWTTSTLGWGAKALGDPRYTFGFDSPAGVFKSIRALVKLWKRAGAHCVWIIVLTDTSAPIFFDPTAAPGSPELPDGNWGRWSKVVGKRRVKSRTDKARYIYGVA